MSTPFRILRCLALTFAVVLAACSDVNVNSSAVSPAYDSDDELYGGVFNMNIGSHVRSIFPLNLMDASAFNLMNQVYEGLVSFDSDGRNIVPALAESYEVSGDGLVYTFHIRKGVKFHDDGIFADGKGREVKAQDIAFCYGQLLTPSENNRMSAFLIDLVRDARPYYNAGGANAAQGELPAGIRVIDDYTLEIELLHPTPNFLTVLTHSCFWVYPKELLEYGDGVNSWCIGTGPFRARIIKMNDVVILERNRNYWMKDGKNRSLPFLDAIRCNFVLNENEQLHYFQTGHLDLILKVPLSRLEALAQEYRQSPNPPFSLISHAGLGIEYYGFQNRGELFADENTRKAFNFAIDRRHIVDNVLHGSADPAVHGFVPPGMPNYGADSIRGCVFNLDSARHYFALAGYPDGRDFPVLTIQVDDGDKTVLAVAETVQSMLSKALNITIELSILPRSRHYERVEEGEIDFWRDRWVADYPDAENFLKLFHGKLVPDDSVKASYLNSVRFKHSEFDQYFEASLASTRPEERRQLMEAADRVIVEHAAVLPLYYPRWNWLVSSRIRNLELNGMGHLDLRRVYIAES